MQECTRFLWTTQFLLPLLRCCSCLFRGFAQESTTSLAQFLYLTILGNRLLLWQGNTSYLKLYVWVPFSVILILFIFYFLCNSLHFSVKDVTEIVTLMILILKFIAKLGECIRYFRRGGWQQDGGDSTTNTKMGTESYYSIVTVRSRLHICVSAVFFFFLLLTPLAWHEPCKATWFSWTVTREIFFNSNPEFFLYFIFFIFSSQPNKQ